VDACPASSPCPRSCRIFADVVVFNGTLAGIGSSLFWNVDAGNPGLRRNGVASVRTFGAKVSALAVPNQMRATLMSMMLLCSNLPMSVKKIANSRNCY
jgi:hypothetical protein